MDFGYTSLGFGAGQYRWTVFSSGIFVYGGELLEGRIDTTAANGVRWGT
jgi:hypothetical protein